MIIDGESMKNGVIIGIAAVVVIIAAAAAVFVLNGDNGNDDSKGDGYRDNVVVTPVTDDPGRETAPAEGRLWILGNANMDDVLDEKDVEWIEKILKGEANEVVFNAHLSDKYSVDVRMADANNDGVVDMKDVEMVRSLIAMKADSPKQIVNYIDVDGAISTAHVPFTTVISTYEQNTKQLQTIHAMGAIIGCDNQSYDNHAFSRPYLTEDKVIFHSYNERKDPDAQLVMRYNPDAILTGTRDIYCNTLEGALPEQRTSMDLVRISSWEDNKTIEGTLTLGFMMCKSAEALDYVEWADKWLGLIDERTSSLSEDQKVKVLAPRGEYSNWNITMNGPRSGKFETTLLAGADNIITRNLTSSSTNVVVTDEWVKAQSDLDFIVCIVYGDISNVEMNGFTNKTFYDTAVEYWSDMTNAYGTQVHVLDNLVSQGTSYVIGAVYMAKWFYPELFEDMNPDEIFQEFMDKFLQYDFDVSAYQANGGIAI